MKAEIDAAIKAIGAEIAERQEALKVLRRLGGDETEPLAATESQRRDSKPTGPRRKKTAARGPYQKRATKPTPAPKAARVKSPRAKNLPSPTLRTEAKPSLSQGLGDKATTVGGAMKMFIRSHSKFSREAIGDWLKADADFARLLEQASPSAVAGNLIYWSNQGYLDRAGDNYTVTVAGQEWFNK